MNLSNRLSVLRIIMTPFFLAVLALKLPWGDYLAAGIFTLAACTDGLDGYIARKRQQITVLGKLLDPLADKLLITAALIALVELARLPCWVAMLIIGREFAVTGLRSLAATENVIIGASSLGKLKTVTQIIAIVALLLQDYPLRLITDFPFGNLAMAVAVFFTVWSGVDYFRQAGFLLYGNENRENREKHEMRE